MRPPLHGRQALLPDVVRLLLFAGCRQAHETHSARERKQYATGLRSSSAAREKCGE